MMDDSKGKGKGRADIRESLGDSIEGTQSSWDAAGESSIDSYMMKYKSQQEEKTSVKRSSSQVKTDEAISKIQGSLQVAAGTEEEIVQQRPKTSKQTPASQPEGGQLMLAAQASTVHSPMIVQPSLSQPLLAVSGVQDSGGDPPKEPQKLGRENFDISTGDAPKDEPEEARERSPTQRRSAPRTPRDLSAPRRLEARAERLQAELQAQKVDHEKEMRKAKDEIDIEKQRQQEMSKQFQEKLQELAKPGCDPSANATIEHLQRELESTRAQARNELEGAKSVGQTHYTKIDELERRNALAQNQTAHVNTLNNAAERRIAELEQKVSLGEMHTKGLVERSEQQVTDAKLHAEAVFRSKEQEWAAHSAEAARVSQNWRLSAESSDARWTSKLEKSEAHVAELTRRAITDKQSDCTDLEEKLEKRQSCLRLPLPKNKGGQHPEIMSIMKPFIS